ncbi:IclR family transcriptional regulator [Azospirillum agricola]|uniref:IclR family transcriptional regulator n=1 Tax=Azospirillum agricola TaxID=1720247 RepID=UPI000A0EF7BB|nr:IclR family transcriptional regulator [Azospirillum agricola]SMH38051.1 transcriptional regulator, IclR family [Azospirillum lipoferum]
MRAKAQGTAPVAESGGPEASKPSRPRGRPPKAPPVTAEGMEEDPADAEAAGKPVGAVLNCVKILKLLSRAAAPVSLTHIVQELGMNTSTGFNILRTLVQEDYVRFDPQAKVYSIGLGVMELARGAATVAGDINLVRPLMERVARDHGVTVTLWRRIAADRMMLVLEAQGTGNMRIRMDVGQRLPLTIGAAGRAMVPHAGLPEAELRRQFAALRWDRPLSFEDFMVEVAETERRGWALDNGNYALGTASIAVPIVNAQGGPLMACTATMFLSRFDEARAAGIAEALGEVARALAPALPHL